MKELLLLSAVLLSILSCEKDCDVCKSIPEIGDQQFSILENSENGTIVDTVVSQSNVSYEIVSGNIEGAFQIDENLGIITVSNSNAINYELYEEFLLAVKITDQSTFLSNGAVIQIDVINVDIPTDGMVGRYVFNGDFKDQSSLNYHGEPNNADLMSIDFLSNNNMVLQLTGADSYVRLPFDFDYINRTVSVWFITTDTTSYAQRVLYSDNAEMQYGSTNIDILKDDISDKNFLRMECGGAYGNDLKIEIEGGRWYHAVLTIDADSVKAYLNGNLFDQTIVNYHHSSDGYPYAHIGCDKNEDKYFLKGFVDNVTIFNRALSAEEVQILNKE
ncbi:hypothetical protein EHM76_05155 [bacterium]|nr:MAG: hypothetical protein EHM76_05155 [bacterium]